MEHTPYPFQTKGRPNTLNATTNTNTNTNTRTAITSTTSVNSYSNNDGASAASVTNRSTSVFSSSEDNNSSQHRHHQPSFSSSLPPNVKSSSLLLSRFPPWFTTRRGSAETFGSGSTMVGSNLSLKGENEKVLDTAAIGSENDGGGDHENGGSRTRSESMRSVRFGGVSTLKTVASLV